MFDFYLARAVCTLLIFSGVPLLALCAAGFLVSLLQAATQIQEQSIGFVVKLAAVSAALFVVFKVFPEEALLFFQESLAGIIYMGQMP